MLIEYRVKNFKSIKDEVVFSLVASADKTNSETHTISTGINSIPKVTKGAAIYGANASGKSNLIESLSYFQKVVQQSASLAVDQTFAVKPFLLDEETKGEPTEFEVTFIKNSIRYQYGFSMNQNQIIEEWLLVYKSAKPQHWFSRDINKETGETEYYFGSSFTGPKDLWRQSTRKNSLFLSTAVQLNSPQLREIYAWIVNDIVFYRAGNGLSQDTTIDMLQNENGKARVENFLASADVGISRVEIAKRKGFVQELKFEPSGKSNVTTREKEILIPQFYHASSTGEVVFEIPDESLGTQRLFALAGPILNILDEGKLLVFDELDSSLHTLLARMIVEIFHSTSTNKRNAQIIFSSHDTELLNNELLRRDQIWLVEKGRDQATTVYPLIEFSPRKKEDLEKGYLYGRYGAIPFLDFSIFESDD